jgi:Flp pilus assembly protein TadD
MNGTPQKWTWLKAAVILFAGAYVFGPAVGGGWLWDDNQEVTANAVLRDPDGLAKIWTGTAGADYFPLKTTVQWFAWRLWGDSPAGYHALSIALHVLSAFLFWRLLQKLGLSLAWLGGLLFVVHPLAVESVAWAAELKNTLSLPLLLVAMIAYVNHDRRLGEGGDGRPARPSPAARPSDSGGKRSRKGSPAPSAKQAGPNWLILSLVFFILAMLAKSSVVMFPFVILLYGWWRRGRVGAADLRASAPFFAVSLGLGLITFWFQHNRAMQPEQMLGLAGGPLSRTAGAGLALAFYLGKTVLPVGLLPIYPRWDIDPPSLAQFAPWLAFGILAGWLWTKRAGWGRDVLFGLGFFAINLLPVIGFVTITYMRITWVADHFAYLSLLGVIGLAVAGLGRLGPSARVSTAVAVLVGAALAWESRGYAEVFRNEDVLWTYTLRRNPEAWSAHYNLGLYLAHHGQSERAAREFEEALRLRPAFVDARINYGNALISLGRLSEAEAQFKEGLRIDPSYLSAHVNLGLLYMMANRAPDAIPQFEEVLRHNSALADVQGFLGDALLSQHRVPEAIAHYEESLRLKPDDDRIRANLNIARQAPAQ